MNFKLCRVTGLMTGNHLECGLEYSSLVSLKVDDNIGNYEVWLRNEKLKKIILANSNKDCYVDIDGRCKIDFNFDRTSKLILLFKSYRHPSMPNDVRDIGFVVENYMDLLNLYEITKLPSVTSLDDED